MKGGTLCDSLCWIHGKRRCFHVGVPGWVGKFYNGSWPPLMLCPRNGNCWHYLRRGGPPRRRRKLAGGRSFVPFRRAKGGSSTLPRIRSRSRAHCPEFVPDKYRVLSAATIVP